jgi:hypothetical protein
VPGLGSAAAARLVAEDSQQSALDGFEQLAATLLAHAAADPHLRFGDESQVRPFQELPGVAEACAASAFARLVFERLRELRPA